MIESNLNLTARQVCILETSLLATFDSATLMEVSNLMQPIIDAQEHMPLCKAQIAYSGSQAWGEESSFLSANDGGMSICGVAVNSGSGNGGGGIPVDYGGGNAGMGNGNSNGNGGNWGGGRHGRNGRVCSHYFGGRSSRSNRIIER